MGIERSFKEVKLSPQEINLLKVAVETIITCPGKQDFEIRTGISFDEKILDKISITESKLKSHSINEVVFFCKLLNILNNDFRWIKERIRFTIEKQDVEKLLEKFDDLRSLHYKDVKPNLKKQYLFLLLDGSSISTILDISNSESDGLYLSFRLAPETDRRLFYVDSHPIFMRSIDVFRHELIRLIDFFKKVIDSPKVAIQKPSVFRGHENSYFIEIRSNSDELLFSSQEGELMITFSCKPRKMKDQTKRSYISCLSVVAFSNLQDSIQALKALSEPDSIESLKSMLQNYNESL